LEELTLDQERALLLLLKDESVERADVSDEALRHSGMSRGRFEAAIASISPEMFQRLVAWAEKKTL
jgi:hypothetical protein